MDDSKFLNRLIYATKNDLLEWSIVPRSYVLRFRGDSKNYYCRKGETIIVIHKYNYQPDFEEEVFETAVILSVCNEQFEILYDLFEDAKANQKVDLLRLYKIIERKANKIDQKLDDFFKDVDGISDADLFKF